MSTKVYTKIMSTKVYTKIMSTKVSNSNTAGLYF
jgi:hypothetical protein